MKNTGPKEKEDKKYQLCQCKRIGIIRSKAAWDNASVTPFHKRIATFWTSSPCYFSVKALHNLGQCRTAPLKFANAKDFFLCSFFQVWAFIAVLIILLSWYGVFRGHVIDCHEFHVAFLFLCSEGSWLIQTFQSLVLFLCKSKSKLSISTLKQKTDS